MIAGIFHGGSGLGNQLFRYVTVRTLAEDKGLDWAMINPQNFKGESFMETPFSSNPITFSGEGTHWNEKVIRENGIDIRSYDPEINFVENNTVIDGEFQDERYWGHYLKHINEWLRVEPLEVPDTTCVIGFRGGEYALIPELFLTEDYWDEATNFMAGKEFQVHTDDPQLATTLFSRVEIVPNEQLNHSQHTNIALNWRAIRHAKYAIIANSSFYILPRLLKHFEDPTAITIAPRYWARRNLGVWSMPQNYYKEFTYL